jgi:putative membrane protein
MRFIQAAILLVFLAVVGMFAIQNTQSLTVQFLNWGLTSSVALLAVGIYFLGMLSGWTVVAFMSRSIRRVTERPKD